MKRFKIKFYKNYRLDRFDKFKKYILIDKNKILLFFS